MTATDPKEHPNGSASRSRIDAWYRRVSYAPSAVTAPISSVPRIRDDSSGSGGLSPCRLEGDFHRADVARRGVHRQMHLAPRAPPRGTLLAGKPFTVTAKTDAIRHRPQTVAGGLEPVALPRRPVDALLSIGRFRGRPEWRPGICTAIFA